MIRKTDITENSCEHRAARNSLLIISQVFFFSFGLKNLRALYESEFPVAPLGGKEMLSLLLKDRGVKWAALSHNQRWAGALPSRRLL